MTHDTPPTAGAPPAAPDSDAPRGDDWWRPLLGERLGVVRRIVAEATPRHFPRSFRLVSAVLADASRWSPWPVDSCGAGYSIGDQPSPVAAAVGEALERYCGNLVTATTRGSYAELTTAGRHAVDPAGLALFSAAQHARPGFPFVRFTADLVTDWTAGRDLESGTPVLVPASLVWASHPAVAADHGRPVTNPVYQPGLAAGATAEQAVLSGLLEIVERDAFVLTWHGGHHIAPIAVPRWFQRLAAGPSGALATRFYSFTNPYGVEVVGALVHDRCTGYLTLGLAARFGLRAALLKALGEALQLQLFVADLDDPQGAYTSRIGPRSPMKPWRRDRRYLDDYADDLHDATDDSCNLQLYLDPRLQERGARALADAATGPTVDATVPDRELAEDGDLGARIRRLVGHLRAVTGAPPVVVDVTTDDVIDAGVAARVVRVVAPGTYANASVAHPFLGGIRHDAAVDDMYPHRSLPLPH